jgi:hypothetical protein
MASSENWAGHSDLSGVMTHLLICPFFYFKTNDITGSAPAVIEKYNFY